IQEDVLTRIRRLPGVDGAAATTALPALARGPRLWFDIAGRSLERTDDRPWAMRAAVTDDFFRTTGVPLLPGRTFQPGDRACSAGVAILGRETARRDLGAPSAALRAPVSPPPPTPTPAPRS